MVPIPDNIGYEAAGAGVSQVPVLQIKADSAGVTTVTSLLKTINFCEKVNIFVTNVGIRFVVEEGKYVQAFVVFKAEVFKTFRMREDSCGFKIPFKELMDCLKILGGDPKVPTDSANITSSNSAIVQASTRTMHISYNGHGTPFCLSLEEQGMTTDIELKTEEPDHLVAFDEVDKVWDINMDAKLLHECLAEVDAYNPEFVTLRVVPNKSLEFRATGSAGSMNISIPKECEGLHKFCNINTVHTVMYKLSLLKHSFKLIQLADKVNLQMAEMDVLSFRLILKEAMETIASFFLMPVTDQDDTNDEEMAEV